jgi:hypothetical protein
MVAAAAWRWRDGGGSLGAAAWQWRIGSSLVAAVAVWQWWQWRRWHQKQHYVPYYLSIVLILSIKYTFEIISMFFTLVRCSIVLLMFLLTFCKFIAFLNVFSCPKRNVPYGKSCFL